MCIVSSIMSSNIPTQAAPFPLEKKMFIFLFCLALIIIIIMDRSCRLSCSSHFGCRTDPSIDNHNYSATFAELKAGLLMQASALI